MLCTPSEAFFLPFGNKRATQNSQTDFEPRLNQKRAGRPLGISANIFAVRQKIKTENKLNLVIRGEFP